MYDVLHDDGAIYIATEDNPAGSVFMHVKVDKSKFCLSLYKKLLELIDLTACMLKAEGTDEVFSIIPLEDATLNNFQRKMGMVPLITNNKYTIYRRKL
jgi:hypothetical protein